MINESLRICARLRPHLFSSSSLTHVFYFLVFFILFSFSSFSSRFSFPSCPHHDCIAPLKNDGAVGVRRKVQTPKARFTVHLCKIVMGTGLSHIFLAPFCGQGGRVFRQRRSRSSLAHPPPPLWRPIPRPLTPLTKAGHGADDQARAWNEAGGGG